MRASSLRPVSVSATWRVVRSKSRSAISSSSSLMLRLTADCVMPNSSPARVKLRCRASVTNNLS